MCVQNLNDSRGLAIRITYRISLRSSSLWEPRHPLLKVVVPKTFFLPANMSCQTSACAGSFLHAGLQSFPVTLKKKGCVLNQPRTHRTYTVELMASNRNSHRTQTCEWKEDRILHDHPPTHINWHSRATPSRRNQIHKRGKRSWIFHVW